MPMLSLRDCVADFSAISCAIGQPTKTIPEALLPQKNQKEKRFQASVLLPALPQSQWAKVSANLMPGIHHFANTSVIFVNRHKVNIGATEYGSAYEDKIGHDENGKAGPFLFWSGQRAADAANKIHAPLLATDREIHLFVRAKSASPFVYWGRLIGAKLTSDGTPPRVRYEIAAYTELKRLHFPGWDTQPSTGGGFMAPPSPLQAPKKAATPRARKPVAKLELADAHTASPGAADNAGASAPMTASAQAALHERGRHGRVHRRGKRALDAGFAVGERVEGNYTDEPIKGWHAAKVVSVACARDTDFAIYGLKYDDGDDGVDVPARFVRRPEDAPLFDACRSKQPRANASALDMGAMGDAEEAAQAPTAVPSSECGDLGVVAPVSAHEVSSAPADMAAKLEMSASSHRSTVVPGKDECKICMDARRTHALLPCGHFFYCETCAEGFVRSAKCPHCSAKVEACAAIYG